MGHGIGASEVCLVPRRQAWDVVRAAPSDACRCPRCFGSGEPPLGQREGGRTGDSRIPGASVSAVVSGDWVRPGDDVGDRLDDLTAVAVRKGDVASVNGTNLTLGDRGGEALVEPQLGL